MVADKLWPRADRPDPAGGGDSEYADPQRGQPAQSHRADVLSPAQQIRRLGCVRCPAVAVAGVRERQAEEAGRRAAAGDRGADGIPSGGNDNPGRSAQGVAMRHGPRGGSVRALWLVRVTADTIRLVPGGQCPLARRMVYATALASCGTGNWKPCRMMLGHMKSIGWAVYSTSTLMTDGLPACRARRRAPGSASSEAAFWP